MKNNLTHLEETVLIEAPIETVFAYITDFRNTSKWHENMKKVGWKKEGPYGVGSEYDWVETFSGIKMDLGGIITSWNAPYSFTWKATTGTFKITGGWTLEQHGNTTRVTRYSDSHLSGIFKWLNSLMVPMAIRQVRKEMQVLKQLIEQQQ